VPIPSNIKYPDDNNDVHFYKYSLMKLFAEYGKYSRPPDPSFNFTQLVAADGIVSDCCGQAEQHIAFVDVVVNSNASSLSSAAATTYPTWNLTG